jgi:predicted protein tyrosine phosphatase
MIKKILFVCSANKQRSKTGEDYFSIKYPEIQFESAGTNVTICRKEGTNPLSEELLIWADKIFVMEKKHLEFIRKQTQNKYNYKIKILRIPDKYKYYQIELLELLEEKVTQYL